MLSLVRSGPESLVLHATDKVAEIKKPDSGVTHLPRSRKGAGHMRTTGGSSFYFIFKSADRRGRGDVCVGGIPLNFFCALYK